MPAIATDAIPTPHAHRSLVCATFAEAVWRALTSLPTLECLPGALFTNVDAAIRDVAGREMASAAGSANGRRLIRFPGPGGFEGFQVAAAGEIVCRLEGHLGGTNNLDLITRVLPAAFASALSTQALPPDMPDAETYRLVGTTMAATA